MTVSCPDECHDEMCVVTARMFLLFRTHDSGGNKLKRRYLEFAYFMNDLIHSNSRELSCALSCDFYVM